MSSFFDYPGGDPSNAHDELVVLEGMGQEDWDRLLDLMERRRYVADEIVIQGGDNDRSLYLVASGEVEVYVVDGRRERLIREQGPGTVLGEVAFMDGKSRSATVRAMTDCELLRLTPDALEVLAARHPDLGRRVMLDLGRVLAARLRQAEGSDG